MNNFKLIKEELKGENIKLGIYDETTILSFNAVINYWINDPEFRMFYNQSLAELPFSAFFWEHPAVLTNKLKNPYECIITPSARLDQIAARSNAFQAYFDVVETVVAFNNLGGDARLIVPCPIREEDVYGHIAQFVREAPAKQIDTFWRQVGGNFKTLIGNTPKWLNTAGFGVPWLHVRIDSRPKYYKYKPYKQT